MKSGVDTVDMMARQYYTKRGTRRRPLAVFYDIVGMAAINEHVLYRNIAISHEKKNRARRQFLIDFSKEMAGPKISIL